MPKPSLRIRLIDFSLAEAKLRGLEAKVARETVAEVLRYNPRTFKRRDPDALKIIVQELLDATAKARRLCASIQIAQDSWGGRETARVLDALQHAGFIDVRINATRQYVSVAMGYMTTKKQAREDAIQAIWTVTLGSKVWHLQTGDGHLYFSSYVPADQAQYKPVLA